MFRFHKLISLRLWFPMQTTSAACGLAYNRLNMYVLSHQDLSKVVRFIDDIIGAFLASPFKFIDFHSYRYRISFRSGNCMLGCLFGSKPLFELLYGPMTHVYVTLHHMYYTWMQKFFLPSSWFHITLTSQWPRWRLKSPASRLFAQSFIRVQTKENTKAAWHWPLCGEFTGTDESPTQRASNAENVSIWWRHHVKSVLFGHTLQIKFMSTPCEFAPKRMQKNPAQTMSQHSFN